MAVCGFYVDGVAVIWRYLGTFNLTGFGGSAKAFSEGTYLDFRAAPAAS